VPKTEDLLRIDTTKRIEQLQQIFNNKNDKRLRTAAWSVCGGDIVHTAELLRIKKAR
jgi:hypothetical protein